ncbi:MAG TPA: TRAP transporter TatT component family protein [Thermoanaerobaculia bacterium]|nr:TRAP transporter TatT component family protein [Thermoanaerobaculia bacterium]
MIFRRPPLKRALLTPAVLAGLLVGLPGCSMKKAAVDTVGTAILEGDTTYARDDDPELVAAAAPFGLKTVEGLLETSPENEALLLSAASGFTGYAYAFVQCEADYVEAKDLARATELRARAKRLYRRARAYGLRGLEVRHRGFPERLRTDTASALAGMETRDAPFLYWTSAAWGSEISLSKGEAELTADQGLVEALARRALALDEAFRAGALHDFFIAWEGGRPPSAGGSPRKAKEHLDRALVLSRGQRAAPLVTYAESVLVASQDRAAFEETLKQALEIDPERDPRFRLENFVARKRARWLLSRTSELFLE